MEMTHLAGRWLGLPIRKMYACADDLLKQVLENKMLHSSTYFENIA